MNNKHSDLKATAQNTKLQAHFGNGGDDKNRESVQIL